MSYPYPPTDPRPGGPPPRRSPYEAPPPPPVAPNPGGTPSYGRQPAAWSPTGYGAAQPTMPQPVPTRHSGVGIASVVLAVFAIVLFLIGMAAAIGGVEEYGEDWEPGEEEAMTIGGLICSGGFLAMAGLGLGIGGVCSHTRKKGFAVVGLVLNICVLMGLLIVMAMGLGE